MSCAADPASTMRIVASTPALVNRSVPTSSAAWLEVPRATVMPRPLPYGYLCHEGARPATRRRRVRHAPLVREPSRTPSAFSTVDSALRRHQALISRGSWYTRRPSGRRGLARYTVHEVGQPIYLPLGQLEGEVMSRRLSRTVLAPALLLAA